MKKTNLRRLLSLVLLFTMLVSSLTVLPVSAAEAEKVDSLEFDNSKWLYNEADDVYYQLGIPYCANPGSSYEYLGVYVPGAYMVTEANGDGTYTLLNMSSAKINGYSAATAPMIIPVDTGSWKYIPPHTEYKISAEAKQYLDEGYVFLNIGVRGKSSGEWDEINQHLPWAVVDFKAAIRYLRYNNALIPGSAEHLFTLGHSAGGAQSGLVGGTGNAPEYFEYLYKIGALGVSYDEASGEYSSTISDAIYGSMQWCPICSARDTCTAYEWMLGQFMDETVPASLVSKNGELKSEYTTRATEGRFEAELSDDLAAAYAEYINSAQFKHPETGELLTLEESEEGIFLAGSYFDYTMDQIELSLNNYLVYQEANDPEFDAAAYCAQFGARLEDDGYADPNGDNKWISYDAASGKASIDSMRDFVVYCKISSLKVVCSTDKLDHSSTNYGILEAHSVHYSLKIAEIIEENLEYYKTLEGWDDEYLTYITEPENEEYADDLGNLPAYRANMADQLYYSNYVEGDEWFAGYGTADVAPYWRISAGIAQSDVSSTNEMNLYLALVKMGWAGEIEDVQFQMIWDQKHVKAENAGKDDAPNAFIEWVNQCMGIKAELPFTDVDESQWYGKALRYVYENGIMQGVSASEFAPAANVTRAQFMTILARASGVDTEGGATWYEKALAWAVENKISDGSSPEADISREQIVTMLWRYAGSPESAAELDGFTDAAKLSDWAKQAMTWAVEKGIVSGYDDATLRPGNSASRAEIAMLIMNFLSK